MTGLYPKNMSLKALSEYVFVSRYAQYLRDKKRRETWPESVKRVFDMHRKKYSDALAENPELLSDLEFAETQVLKKRVLGSQRALQFGGDDVLRKNARIYNCCGLHVDKPKAFQDVVWLLLMGCGVGFSVQTRHVGKLPALTPVSPSDRVTFKVPDTCEGWADAVGVLLSSYFVNGGFFPEYLGKSVDFDFSGVRPKGSLIAGKFKAPGPEPLKRGLEKIRNLLSVVAEGKRQMRAIEVYDIIMHAADFVISGGVRRSATLSLFSKSDKEMAEAKIGDWFNTNPQRARSNNSAALVRDDVLEEEFRDIFKNTREFGEPGFVFLVDYNQVLNPCCEISWVIPETDSKLCTVGVCNLSEINGKFCDSPENFYQACRAAAVIGTLQAGYTDFPYLGEDTERFVRGEALLGVSITGWMDNPDILFDKNILERGAAEVKKVNARLADMLGIQRAARLCTAKPSGHTSCILQTASGIHPHHAKRYIRRAQSNKQEHAAKVYSKVNPAAVTDSVWSANNSDYVVSFTCEVPPGAVVKNQISALDMLEKVKIAQKHWVIAGVNDETNTVKGLSHSVSNTITVQDHEWDEVRDYIFKNREFFTGISMLSMRGDLDYMQAPNSTVLSPPELVREYGDASVFASGLIVDGLKAFEDYPFGSDNLWVACDYALGVRGPLPSEMDRPEYPARREFDALADYFSQLKGWESWFLKQDWIRRIRQFSQRYFGGDLKRATYCLKHVSLWKTFVDLRREYKAVDWKDYTEEESMLEADTLGAQACSGGACELT